MVLKRTVGQSDVVIMAGSTHPHLADEICLRLNMRRSEIVSFHAGNRETMIQLTQSVRFKDCYILQTGTNMNVNDSIMEFLLMGFTCHTSACNHLVGVIPYLPYGKQARQRKRGAIPARLLAKLIERAGFQHIITIDLQHKEIQGFFDIPVENLRASPFLISHIQEQMTERNIDRSQVVIVASEHTSSVRKATAYSQRLKVDLAILHGNSYQDGDELDRQHSLIELDEDSIDAVDGRSSPPPVRSIEMVPGGETLPVLTNNSQYTIRPLKLVGDVEGKMVILVENVLDDVVQLCQVAHYLKTKEKAKEVHLVATHALFSIEAAQKLNQSEFDEIVVTNTIPHDLQSAESTKIKTIDISILLTEAIRRLHNNESLSYLFADVSIDD